MTTNRAKAAGNRMPGCPASRNAGTPCGVIALELLRAVLRNHEVNMKNFVTLALAAGIALGTAGIAEARQGCGVGYHSGPHGRCIANARNRVVVTPRGLIVGNFYTGRGYWDGHRYFKHRARNHRGWRYY